MHGETGAKLDSEMSQIACEMKQTTPEKNKTNQKKRKKEKGKITKTTQGPIKVSSKAGWHKSKKQKQNKTNTLFFLLDIFQTADDKTTLKELEESKSNRQVCLTVS